MLCNVSKAKKRKGADSASENIQNAHQPGTAPPSSLRTSTDCLITETHSSPLCSGRCAPPARYHTVWELNHPRVCVCVWDRESRMCLKETSHSTGRQRCLPLPLSLSLSVSDLFSLLSERCWLGGTKRKESLKLPPLRETQPFVGVKHCAFEWACSVACFDARRADKSTLHGCGCLWNVGTEQPWDGLAALISRSGCQHPDLVCPIRPCSWADNLICFPTNSH